MPRSYRRHWLVLSSTTLQKRANKVHTCSLSRSLVMQQQKTQPLLFLLVFRFRCRLVLIFLSDRTINPSLTPQHAHTLANHSTSDSLGLCLIQGIDERQTGGKEHDISAFDTLPPTPLDTDFPERIKTHACRVDETATLTSSRDKSPETAQETTEEPALRGQSVARENFCSQTVELLHRILKEGLVGYESEDGVDDGEEACGGREGGDEARTCRRDTKAVSIEDESVQKLTTSKWHKHPASHPIRLASLAPDTILFCRVQSARDDIPSFESSIGHGKDAQTGSYCRDTGIMIGVYYSLFILSRTDGIAKRIACDGIQLLGPTTLFIGKPGSANFRTQSNTAEQTDLDR
ncbi:hypothetical protein KCV05_g169, partial [Aureobasidium melanogenum]